ncbi:MAG: GNAT family N-acetyltransferase [Candidatus Dormiibacterota bacterium]|jgi:GNAT superfamily N-acetyltransferase
MVRQLEEGDFPTWRELWLAYLKFYRAEVSDSVTRDSFRRLHQRADGLVGLVAPGDDGQLQGFVHLVFHPSTWSSAPYCYVEDLFVAPPARGTAVAMDLLQAAYAEADRRGAARTYWETQAFNGAARSLYDQVAHPTSFVVYERCEPARSANRLSGLPARSAQGQV